MTIGEEYYNLKKGFENFPKVSNSDFDIELPFFIDNTRTNIYSNIKKRTTINPIQRRTNENNKILSGVQNITKSLKKVGGILEGITKTLAIIGTGVFMIVAALSMFNVKSQESKSEGIESEEGYSGLSTGRMSEKGKEQLKKDEGGFQSTAYWDKDGYSIGYGHHGLVNGKPIYKGQKITKEEADKLFDQDIKIAENKVNKYLKTIKTPISQNQYDAMVNYAYNAGSLGPKFKEKLRSGDYKGAAEELEVGNENLERMARIRSAFLSDVTEDNKLKNNITAVAQKGGKIDGHKIKREVKLSEQAKLYLSQIEGSDTITSGMEGKHAGSASNPASHYSGNKIDVGLGGKTHNQIKKIAIPYMKHPATLHVAFEGITQQKSMQIEQEIKNEHPDIAKRISTGNLKIYHWAFKYSKGPHLDILISKDRLYANNYTNKNTETIKQINKQTNIEKTTNKNQGQSAKQSNTISQQKNIVTDNTEKQNTKNKYLSNLFLDILGKSDSGNQW